MSHDSSSMPKSDRAVSRRTFVVSSLAATGTLSAAAGLLSAEPAAEPAQQAPSPQITRKIKAGLVGCGGRGSWIAGLFKQHGGYEFIAAADYFQERADKTGDAIGVPKANRFSGLSGYKRVLDSGAEAVVLETPPYFFAEHAEAAAQAGLHVYMAKPVAVDVPGALRVSAANQAATEKKRVFLVDYQMPTDPMNIEVARRLRAAALGTLQLAYSCGMRSAPFPDPPMTENIESRLVNLVWISDEAIGGGYIGNYDIHIIDAVIWALQRRPVSAYGRGGRFRKNPHGDSYDTNVLTFNFDDGLAWSHEATIASPSDWITQESLDASIQGSAASARLSYYVKAYVRGGPQHFPGGPVKDLYKAGAQRNIASFYEQVTGGTCKNDTAGCAVDGILTCILGREAAGRGELLTLDAVIKENKALLPDLRGLKA